MLKKILAYIINSLLNISDLPDMLGDYDEKFIQVENKLSDLKKQINDIKADYISIIPVEMLNSKVVDIDEKNKASLKTATDDIEHLKNNILQMNNQLSDLNDKVKNPLGAGRKERGSEEDVRQILELRKLGKSLGEIAKIMTNESGEHWGKSTVSNIINRTTN